MSYYKTVHSLLCFRIVVKYLLKTKMTKYVGIYISFTFLLLLLCIYYIQSITMHRYILTYYSVYSTTVKKYYKNIYIMFSRLAATLIYILNIIYSLRSRGNIMNYDSQL